MEPMKNLIRWEEAGLFLLTIFLFLQLAQPWWLFFALLFVPDLSMLGYLGGNRFGAIVYNLVHHRGVGAVLYLAGMAAPLPGPALVGVILLAHSTFDRLFGYGLKQFQGFAYTSLGKIGNSRSS